MYPFVHFPHFALARDVTLGSVGAVPAHPPGPATVSVHIAFNTSAFVHLFPLTLAGDVARGFVGAPAHPPGTVIATVRN
eukprot:9473569-Pyramimonas_sp.AAC.1